jgi:molybdopterin-containing oxidoreductase family membrane subunit
MVFNATAFVLFLIPQTRERFLTLNIGCVLIFLGVWIEKGPGLILPGFVPSPLGEVWTYLPTVPEVLITLGIWAIGLMIYTLLLKVAIPIEVGEFRQIKDRLHDLVSPRQ